LTLSSDALNNPNGNALFGTGANNNNIDIPNWTIIQKIGHGKVNL